MPARLSARAVARAWLKKGVLTVPIAPGTKRPRGGEDWNRLRIDEEIVDSVFQVGDSVGALWGEPSAGVCDVDLDWDEALPLAAALLPETYVYGRTGRPASHYLYQIAGHWRSAKWRFDREVVVELRGTGSQSLIPGSQHPKGRYRVDHDVPWASIDRGALEVLLGRIAAGAVVVRHYPDGGARHDLIAALAGGVKRDGWGDDEIVRWVEAIVSASSDDDREQRYRTIRSVLSSSDATYGWKTVGEILGREVLDAIRKWLKGRDPTVLEVPERVEEREERLHQRWSGVIPDGLVGEVADWAARRSFVQQPAFDLAVGLMSVAVASRNGWIVDGWETPLQPYFMLSAPTGAGKESALESIYAFARRARLGNSVFSGFQSYHSMLDRLADTRQALWLWDEAARKLKGSGSGPDFALVTHLLSMYGKAATAMPGLPARGQPIPEIERPFFTIIGASQPQPLVEAVTGNDIVVGLINRFVLFDGGDEGGVDNSKRETTIFPSRLDRAIEKLRAERRENDFQLIRWESTKAYNAVREFQSESRKRAIESELGALWSRAAQNAIILAGIVTLGRGTQEKISLADARWGCAFSEWSINAWLRRLEGGMRRNRLEGDSLKLENLIRRARTLKGARSEHDRLLARGLAPRSVLQRYMRHLTARQFDELILMLTDAEVIGEGDANGARVYWIK